MPTETRLFNRAIYYLGRYAASSSHLAQVLRRRARRDGEAHGIPAEAVDRMVEAVIAKLGRLGYLDDAAFALTKARGLAGRGRSVQRIRATLAQAGVAREAAAGALAALREETADPDLTAAIRLARRRRLGPWREPEARAAERLRDLAKLGRAGFSGTLAREVIDAPSPEALEERLAAAG